MFAQNSCETHLALIERLTLRTKLSRLCRRNQRQRSARTRQKNSAFLERLADAADANGRGIDIETSAIGDERRIGRNLPIIRIHAAAGKHQRTGAELDLTVTLDHEDFHAAGCFAQQQHSGSCSQSFRLVRYALIAAHQMFARLSMRPTRDRR